MSRASGSSSGRVMVVAVWSWAGSSVGLERRVAKRGDWVGRMILWTLKVVSPQMRVRSEKRGLVWRLKGVSMCESRDFGRTYAQRPLERVVSILSSLVAARQV